jgi:hypothetical protein
MMGLPTQNVTLRSALTGRPGPRGGAETWSQVKRRGLPSVASMSASYVVADAQRAGRALLTLAVDDLAERVAGLAAIEPGPGGMPTAVVDDPDGNRIQLFEDPSA